MAYDANTMLHAPGTNLTVTITDTSLQINRTPLAGLFVRLTVPQATGTSPTLDVKVQESSDNSTFVDLVTFAQITVAGIFRRRVSTQKAYVRTVHTVGGTTPNFGIVVTGFETGGEYIPT